MEKKLWLWVLKDQGLDPGSTNYWLYEPEKAIQLF